MIDSQFISKKSPFNYLVNDNLSNYDFSMFTHGLLKFYLEESFKNKINDIKLKETLSISPRSSFLNSERLDYCFNSFLQNFLKLNYFSIIENGDSDQIGLTDDESDVEFLKNNTSLTTFNYLDLKVLIENSICDLHLNENKTIYSYDSVQKLKQIIKNKSNKKELITNKVLLLQKIIKKYLISNDSSISDDIFSDVDLLKKIINQYYRLVEKLTTLSNQLTDLNSKLYNHNLFCLSFGYFEDIKNYSNATLDKENNNEKSNFFLKKNLDKKDVLNFKSKLDDKNESLNQIFTDYFDSLSLNISSKAVEKNITLPPPPSVLKPNLIESNLEWIINCIYLFIEKNTNDFNKQYQVFNDMSITNDVNPNILFNDLKFSYEYLSDQFKKYRIESTNKINNLEKSEILLKQTINNLKYLLNNILNKNTTHNETFSITTQNKKSNISEKLNHSYEKNTFLTSMLINNLNLDLMNESDLKNLIISNDTSEDQNTTTNINKNDTKDTDDFLNNSLFCSTQVTNSSLLSFSLPKK